MSGTRAGRALVVGALAASLAVAGTVLLLAPSSGAAPSAMAQDEPTTTTTEDSPVPTLLRTTTSTAPSSTTTVAEELASTTEPSTNTTRGSSGVGTTTTVDPNAPGGADLLIRGDGTEGAESTTPTLGGTRISDSGPSDGTLIALVIVGLVVVAGAMGILTWRYWVATRPPPLEPDPDTAAE